MKHDDSLAMATETAMEAAVPSAEFIERISEFFETDPSDLLAELGYYERNRRPSLADASLSD